MKKKGLKLTALLLAAGMISVGAYHAAAAKLDSETIYNGVYLDDVYVGGLTKEEAMKEYNQYVDGIEDLKLTFTTSVGSCTTTLKDIGVAVSVEDAVEQAYNYGRQGSILSRYKEIRQLEVDNAILVPEKKFNKKKLKDILENETGDIVTAAKNASITRENGEFIVHEGTKGTAIKVEETIKEVEEVFSEKWEQKDLKVTASVEEEQPKYTTADFEKIDSVLGQAVTSYNQGNTARSQNISTGTSKISGTVLMPGEQFSVHDTVTPFTEENGYANAGMYVSDDNGGITTVDGYGGGICQVSTTLYNAVLKAELEVDERSPHSLTVSYVDASKDAAIAGDYMDFKFTNNLEYPIYIEGYAGGGSVSFAVYGHETRPANRTISFESKIVETIEPGDPEEIKDDTLEEGTRVVEESAHTGYYAELWKHVYIDGVEDESQLVRVNQSQYRAQRGKVRVGTKKKEKEKDKDDEEENDEKKDNDKDKDKDKTTEAPATTEAVTEAPTEAPSGGDENEGE